MAGGKPIEIVDLNEDHPKEDRERLFIQSEGGNHHHLHLADSKAGRGAGRLWREGKGRLQVAGIGGWWHGEAGNGVFRSGASAVIGGGNMLGFP